MVGVLAESLLPVSQQTQPLWAPLSLPQPGEARSPCKSVPPITAPPALSSESAHLLGVGPVVGGAGLAWSGTPQGPHGAWGTGHLPGSQRVWLSSWEYSLSSSRAALQRPLLSQEGLLHWEGRYQASRGSQAPPTWAAGPAPKNPDQAPASRLSLVLSAPL